MYKIICSLKATKVRLKKYMTGTQDWLNNEINPQNSLDCCETNWNSKRKKK